MSAPEPLPFPPRHAGPRSLEEEYAELGEEAPWLVQCRRGLHLKQTTRLQWSEIAQSRLFVSPSQFRRWRVAYAGLKASGHIVERASA
jgi:hypothetical protein